MAYDYSTDGHWIAELILDMPTGRKSYGRFNHDALTFGSEGGTLDDPEEGQGIPVGGKQTVEEFDIDRPYRRSRDRPVFDELKPLRGRVWGNLLVWEADDDKNPTTSKPMLTLYVLMRKVTIPRGNAGGSDVGDLVIGLQPQA